MPASARAFTTSSTGNMFFEYGGAPRKMYPAVAVMARLLAPDFQFVRKWDKPEWLQAYEFRSRGRTVVIVVDAGMPAPRSWTCRQGFEALDLMGNRLETGEVVAVGESPVYLVGVGEERQKIEQAIPAKRPPCRPGCGG